MLIVSDIEPTLPESYHAATLRRAWEAEAEVERLKKIIEGMAERIYRQSELLSRKAEKDHASEV